MNFAPPPSRFSSNHHSDRGRHRLGIAVIAVGPEALAGDDVGHAVAVHVRQLNGVGLREDDAGFARLRGRAGDEVPLPAVARLLEPREAIPVRGEAGDDVRLAVAIHVEDIHLRAATAELRLVLHPHRIAVERLRLFPPAVRLEDVHLAVAVHIAEADAVGEALERELGRDGMPGPFFIRLLRIECRVAEMAAAHAEQVGPAVAVDVREHGRLVVGHVERDMLVPRRILALRILIPDRLLAGEAHHDVVRPAVAVDVVGRGDEVVAVAVRHALRAVEALDLLLAAVLELCLGALRVGIDDVALFEVRSLKPVRPVNARPSSRPCSRPPRSRPRPRSCR